jgi:hypothetical protein
MGRRVRTTAAMLIVLAAPAVLTGCQSEDGGDARGVALAFERAVVGSDWAVACRLLAPATKSEVEQAAGKRCARALREEDLPAARSLDHVEEYGTMAQVRFAADTLFLAEFRGGWKVMAAGCSPVPGRPYDCIVKGN